jgi:hypothetical protein
VDQLVLIALVLAAALVDLFVRWARRKMQPPGQGPAEPREEEPPPELEWFEDEAAAAERELREAERAAQQRAARQRELQQRAVEPPVQPARAPALEEVMVRRPAVPATVAKRRRARARRWIAGPSSARRGIVLMTVLGPCRGLE